jgi:hypothetical protein
MRTLHGGRTTKISAVARFSQLWASMWRLFYLILNVGFLEGWTNTPFLRNDVDPDSGVPQSERRHLNAAGGLGRVMHLSAQAIQVLSSFGNERSEAHAKNYARCSRYLLTSGTLRFSQSFEAHYTPSSGVLTILPITA